MTLLKRMAKAIDTETYIVAGLVAVFVTWIAWRTQ